MNGFFNSLSRFIADRPRTVLSIVLAITAIFCFGFRGLGIDADMTDDIPSSVPEKAFYDEVGRIFPSDDFLIVAITNSEGIFTPDALRQMRDWSDALSGVDGVKNVISLSSAGIIRGTEDGIVIEDAMAEVPETAEEIAAYRARVESSDMTKSLIGKDGESACILVTLREGLDAERLPRVRITLPAGAAPDDAFLSELAAMQAVPESADASVQAVSRVYLTGSAEDRVAAMSGYGESLAADAKGRSAALVVLERGVALGDVGPEIRKIAETRGWKATVTDEPVTGYSRVMATIANLPSRTDGPVYVSGAKAVSSIVGKLLIKDLALLFPVVLSIIALILFLSFRTLRGVLMPLGNVLVSVIWAMGLMGLLGQSITMATMILPIILIAVGTAYTIHVINRFYEDLAYIADKKEAIASTVSHVGVPVILAGATTMIGFGSLAASSIPALRMFGVLSALGILFALTLSLTLTPALLRLLPRPKARPVGARDDSRLAGALAGLGRRVARRPGVIAAVCLALIVGIGAFAPRVSFETNTLNSFKKGSDIRRASEYLNDNFTGITVMTVVVRTDEDGAILEPSVLRAMDGLQSRLETLRVVGEKVVAPGESGYEDGTAVVGGSQSIVTFVKGINKALNADDPAYDKVPDDVTLVPVTTEAYAYSGGRLMERDAESSAPLASYGLDDGLRVDGGYGFFELGGTERRVDLATGSAVDLVPGRAYAGQLVFQYENSGNPENIEGFIDNPRRTARVNVFIKSSSSGVIGQVQSRARAYIAESFPAGYRADITGLSNLTLAILRLLVQSQIGSVLASLVICFLFISLVSRNLVEGLFSIVPLTGALAINFGAMALFHIPIDISTATIASIGIGIGIDYTLHFTARLKLSLRTYPFAEAVEATMRTTGKGIFVNALAVAGGFAALLASQLRGNVNMGLLMALIMLTSSTFAVTLLPALFMLFKPRFLVKEPTVKESI